MRGSRLDRAFYAKFGATLRRERVRLCMTQQEIADAIGVTRAGVSMIETGRNGLDLKAFSRICDVLGVSPAKLLPSFEDIG